MLSFQHTEFLMGLIFMLPLILLFIFILRWKKQVKNRIGDAELVDSLTTGYSAKNFSYKFYLQLAAIILCIIGAANLRSPKASNAINRTGIDIMIALDVSNSMLAQDIKPSRLERAKQLLKTLIDNIGDNRLGLVVFAGQAYLQMPLTTDGAAAKMYITNVSPTMVPTQGTEVSSALNISNAALGTKEKKYKAVILITDGETHDEKSLEAAKQLEQNGVVVHTIGLGSLEGSPIFDATSNDFRKDESGNTVVSKLNEQMLKDIAATTSGSYTFFTNVDEVAFTVMKQLDAMEKKQIGGNGPRDYNAFFQWFLLLAFILLLLEIIIPERKKKLAL
jgi:Ca-activated chloride channel family protein